MDLRPFRVVLWTAGFLFVAELGLEVRAVRRGWEGVLLGKGPGWSTNTDDAFGPAEGFPFRSLRVAPDERADLRLWVASSSYGEDIQLLPDEIFPNRTGALLGDGGASVQVLNASHAGYPVHANTRELRELGGEWRPDVVLLYQMSNDVDRASEILAAQASLGGGGAPGQAERSDERASAGSRIARVTERMTSYKHLKTQITARLVEGRPMRDTLGPEGVAIFERDVRDFIAAARELDVEPVLCTFATSHLRADLDEVPRSIRRQMLSMNMVLSLEGWVDSIERFNEALRALAREEDLILVDVAAEVGGWRGLFRDFWHFTPEGHGIVAELLARELAADGQ